MSNQSDYKTMVEYSYYLVTGILTFAISMWFASGTIAENPEGVIFSEPVFLWNIAIWVLGVVIYLFKLRLLGMMISLLPVLYFLYLFMSPIFFF